MAKLSHEELAEIKERICRVSFDGAYVKGGPWKGYEVKNKNNGIVIAEADAGYDAEFIAHARTDIPALLDMIAELQWYVNAQGKRLDRAENLLMEAQGVMDSTEVWSEINRYLYGEDDDE
ncbi:hypothetical protein MKX29_24355 [Cytobacillus sp. FSL R7-0696]|uniref:hypothetical protein n=1 Tax=Cytobacillus sp. FSL R7-0696 TaxID=2921691 RepID=UPI0030FC94DA